MLFENKDEMCDYYLGNELKILHYFMYWGFFETGQPILQHDRHSRISSHCSHTVLLAFIVYFRKLPYFGLNILRYPWADRAGPCRKGPCGSRATSPSPSPGHRPRMDWDVGTWGPALLWHFWGWRWWPQKAEMGVWALGRDTRAGGVLWEGTLTWGSSLHYPSALGLAAVITSVTAWYFPAYCPTNIFALMDKHGGSCWLVTQL